MVGMILTRNKSNLERLLISLLLLQWVVEIQLQIDSLDT